MGYNGGGLGKHENGIQHPIIVERNDGRHGIGTRRDISSDIKLKKSKRVNNRVKTWPQGTVLIIGDSMIGGIEERKLKKYRAKVRTNPGACVDDIYDYIAPLLKKEPAHIILHIGTNDSTFKSARHIHDEIMNLKNHINEVLPNTVVHLSCPILRVDNGAANRVLQELDSKLKRDPKCVANDNIDGLCLSKKGLHLNRKGTAQLAANYIKLMQGF